MSMSTRVSRRAFFGTVSGLAAVSRLDAQDRGTSWDLSWFESLKGKHKQLFDLGAAELGSDSPLRLPNNYLNTFREVLHVEPPDITIAVGVAGAAFPINASDALWEKFKLGEVWKITDPETSKPAVRNIYLGAATGGPAPTIRSLMARGGVFWQCNIALGGVSSRLAHEIGGKAEAIRAELAAGLNPGVKIVPAHSMAVGLAQEHGFTYMRP